MTEFPIAAASEPSCRLRRLTGSLVWTSVFRCKPISVSVTYSSIFVSCTLNDRNYLVCLEVCFATIYTIILLYVVWHEGLPLLPPKIYFIINPPKLYPLLYTFIPFLVPFIYLLFTLGPSYPFSPCCLALHLYWPISSCSPLPKMAITKAAREPAEVFTVDRGPDQRPCKPP